MLAFIPLYDAQDHIVATLFWFGRFKRASRTGLRSRYASLSNAPRPPVLQTPEEIHICELLHLIDISSLCDLLIVEEHPCRLLLIRQLLANKRNVVPSVNRAALVTHNGL